MVSPPKKKNYGIIEQKGERSKILIALMKGKENTSLLTKRLGYKNRKSSWITKYIQRLDKEGFLEEDRIIREDKLGRIITNKGFKLNLSKFFFECSRELDVLFNPKEKSLIRKLFTIVDVGDFRNELVIECIWNFEGSIIKTLLSYLVELFLNNNLVQKELGISKKIRVLLLNQDYSPNFHKSLEKFEEITLDESGGDHKYEDYVNRRVKTIYGGINIRNPDTKVVNFCDNLIPVRKFQVPGGHTVRVRQDIDKKEMEKELISMAEKSLRYIKKTKGEKVLNDYAKHIKKTSKGIKVIDPTSP